MLEAVIVMLTAGFIAVGVVNEVVIPTGEYAIEKGTEAYDAGKELYQEKVVGTE
jgi:hypothetical protein